MASGDEKQTTISQPLLLLLIESIQEQTKQLEQLNGRVTIQDARINKLAENTDCLYRETEKFRKRFEPYLTEAVESRRTLKGRKEKVITAVVGSLTLSALLYTGAALWGAVVESIAHRLKSGVHAPGEPAHDHGRDRPGGPGG